MRYPLYVCKYSHCCLQDGQHPRAAAAAGAVGREAAGSGHGSMGGLLLARRPGGVSPCSKNSRCHSKLAIRLNPLLAFVFAV